MPSRDKKQEDDVLTFIVILVLFVILGGAFKDFAKGLVTLLVGLVLLTASCAIV